MAFLYFCLLFQSVRLCLCVQHSYVCACVLPLSLHVVMIITNVLLLQTMAD